MFKKFFMRALAVMSAVAVFTFGSMDAQAAEKQNAQVTVKYQHVRNATAKVEYGGKTFLVDPFLAKKGAYPGFELSAENPNKHQRIPMIDMAEPAEKVIEGVDAVILTHTHLDHWDEAAQKLLPKDITFFVQNAGDARIIREQGFTDVRVIGKHTPFDKVNISKTGGQHGTDEMYSKPWAAEILGEAMGFVFEMEGGKTVYVVGDTTWNQYVDDALEMYHPDIVVLNTGYARVKDGINGKAFSGSLIMGTDDVIHAYKAAPQAQIIAVHMDAVNHTMVTSDDVRELVTEKKMEDRVSVPREGETIKY